VVHLALLGDQLRQRGVGLHVLEQGIDTPTSEGGPEDMGEAGTTTPRRMA
jgi:hypothetical protein